MAILGLGTDIVEIVRIQSIWQQYGKRFAQRILTQQEWQQCQQCADPARFIAKRFAVKEAASKALGTGIAQGVSLHHIYIEHDAVGRPLLKLIAQAANVATQLGYVHSHVTLSDERAYVVATVILEG